MEYGNILKNPAYSFITQNPHLGKHVILLGLAGSYSYGTNNAESDIDIRGCALNSKSDLLGMTVFEQYVDEGTDTVIYGLNKMLPLLLSCNPNTIELLGLKKEHYLYLNDIGQRLLEERKIFLSRRAIHSFGGYADAQLRRLQNALARDSYAQSEKEQHIFHSVKNAMYEITRRYAQFEDGSIRLYVDKAVNPEFETEIFLDVSLRHYPLRDYRNMWGEMNNIVREYDKLGKRNRKKDDNHLNKHAMHLVRLFMMALDILEKEEICTYRDKEQELLLQIRNGEFQKEDKTFRSEFYDLIAAYEKRLAYAAEHTALPQEPDMKAAEAFLIWANERVVSDAL